MTAICSARRYHAPAQPASPDFHHVIPQAWQRFWQPPDSDLARLTPLPGVTMWDKRTVELCPNCHRGVHERIVALMHGVRPGHDHLWPIAQLALDRFTAAGGSLDALRAAGQWGEQ